MESTRTLQHRAQGQAHETLSRLSGLAGQRFATSAEATAALLRTISDVLGMRTSWVSEVDASACELRIVSAHNEPGGSEVAAGSASPLFDTFCSLVASAETPRPLIIEDVRGDPEYSGSTAARVFPAIGSYIGVPIVLADGSVHGTLCGSDPEPRRITGQQADLLTVLSRLLATEIERDRELLARREAEERFHAFMEHSPVIAYMKDADGRYVYMNARFERAFGLQPAGLIGKTDLDWFDPETSARAQANDRQVLATGDSQEFIEPVNTVEGDTQYWYSFKFPVTDAGGNRLIGGVSAEITERRNREIERARLAAIVDDTQDAIFAKALDGAVITWNAAAERLYGYTAAAMIGNTTERLIPDDMPSDLPMIAERLRAGQRVAQYETRRKARDGRILDVELTVSPIRDADGVIIGSSTIARDITDHNRLIAERNRLYAEVRNEIARAAEVQASLLPRSVPVLADYQFAATCLPAREVGGDFFDWNSTGGRVRITLGDVSGKGMPAALLMTTTRAALRAASSLPIDEALTVVNQMLGQDLGHSDAFVTMFHAELSPDGAIAFADAGHGMAMIIGRDGSVRALTQHQLPIGIDAFAAYRTSPAHLHPGEILIVYSDGLPDARPDLALDGPVQVAALCSGCTDVHELLNRLVEATEGGEPRPDDLTLILVQRLEETE